MLDSSVNESLARAGQEMQMTALDQRLPHVLMRPRVYPDGNQWCALYGEDLQEGVAGFGATPYLACMDFDKTWMCKKLVVPAGVMACDKPQQEKRDA